MRFREHARGLEFTFTDRVSAWSANRRKLVEAHISPPRHSCAAAFYSRHHSWRVFSSSFVASVNSSWQRMPYFRYLGLSAWISHRCQHSEANHLPVRISQSCKIKDLSNLEDQLLRKWAVKNDSTLLLTRTHTHTHPSFSAASIALGPQVKRQYWKRARRE